MNRIFSITTDIDSEIKLFADDCVCHREMKGIENTVKLQEEYRWFWLLGKEMEHEIPTSQMQYLAEYKETYHEDQCFL